MEVMVITKENYSKEVLESDKPVLIDFWASWCGPCRMMSPVVDEIANENPQLKVCKVNVDDEPELAQKFGIMSIPTLAAVVDGKFTDKVVGFQPKGNILNLFK